MAKIENTTVYPTVTPAADDLLIATDVSNNNETVTFLVSSITGGGGVNQGLQSVLDTGNTATQTMTLTGSVTLLGGAGVGFIDLCQVKLGGSVGAAGQVLTSQGAGSCAIWATPAATSCCTIQSTLTAGNTTTLDFDTTGSINMTGAGKILSLSNGTIATISGTGSNLTMGTNSDIFLGNTSELNFGATATINDYSGSTGAIGQVLTVNAAGTGVEWGTLPAPATPPLQQVLTVGNTATAIGISFSGPSTTTFDTTATISSSADNAWLGTNTFSANGTLVTTAGIALTGSLWDGVSTGNVGDVLTSTTTGVSWQPTTGGVTSVTAGAPGTSTGTVTTITPTTGAVVVTPNAYAGGNNIGHVPTGGTASNFLRGDGTWQSIACCNLQDTLTAGNTGTTSIILSGLGVEVAAPNGKFTTIEDGTSSVGAAGEVLSSTGTGLQWVPPGGGAYSWRFGANDGSWLTVSNGQYAGVTGGTGISAADSGTGSLGDPYLVTLTNTGATSVTAAASGTSTGNPLTITPTTGAVTVASNAYAGTTNVGHVPAGGTGTTFLRGDGSWQVPVADNSVIMWNRDFTGATVSLTASRYYTYLGANDASFDTLYNRSTNDLGAVMPTTLPAFDHQAGFTFWNTNSGACGTDADQLRLCATDFTIITDVAGTFYLDLFKGDPCDPDTAFLQAASCTITVAGGVIGCCSATLSGIAANVTLLPGEGFFFTLRVDALFEGSFSGKMALKLLPQ